MICKLETNPTTGFLLPAWQTPRLRLGLYWSMNRNSSKELLNLATGAGQDFMIPTTVSEVKTTNNLATVGH
eukprot:764729-Hanusia_phi.AAC.1